VAIEAASRAGRVNPLVTEHQAGAVLLGAVAVIFLTVCPLAADGERLVQWWDLLLVPIALGGVLWLRRQRRDYEKAAILPPTATPASTARVIRTHAAWGVLFLLFVLSAAASTPDFFATGLAAAVFAGGLALEARHATRWEAGRGSRLYRDRMGWSKPGIYRTP
jgi:hypothetical protein